MGNSKRDCKVTELDFDLTKVKKLTRAHIASFGRPDGLGEHRRFSKFLKCTIQEEDKYKAMAAAVGKSEAIEFLTSPSSLIVMAVALPVVLVIMMMMIDWDYRRRNRVTSISL